MTLKHLRPTKIIQLCITSSVINSNRPLSHQTVDSQVVHYRECLLRRIPLGSRRVSPLGNRRGSLRTSPQDNPRRSPRANLRVSQQASHRNSLLNFLRPSLRPSLLDNHHSNLRPSPLDNQRSNHLPSQPRDLRYLLVSRLGSRQCNLLGSLRGCLRGNLRDSQRDSLRVSLQSSLRGSLRVSQLGSLRNNLRHNLRVSQQLSLLTPRASLASGQLLSQPDSLQANPRGNPLTSLLANPQGSPHHGPHTRRGDLRASPRPSPRSNLRGVHLAFPHHNLLCSPASSPHRSPLILRGSQPRGPLASKRAHLALQGFPQASLLHSRLVNHPPRLLPYPRSSLLHSHHCSRRAVPLVWLRGRQLVSQPTPLVNPRANPPASHLAFPPPFRRPSLRDIQPVFQQLLPRRQPLPQQSTPCSKFPSSLQP